MAKAPLFVAASLGVTAELELATAVQIWRDDQEALAKAVEKERASRQALIDKYFPNFEEGVHTGSLREFNLKCTMTINRSVVQEQYAAAHAHYIEKQNEARLALLNKVFRAKQEVNVKDWKALSPDERKVLADIVTEKPGLPQLKLEPKTS